MVPYSEWRPTGFDPAGAFLDDRQDWLVLGLMQTRDSGPLDKSNFAAALAILGGEGDECEVHRFGHWGPGWFEVIIVKPGTDVFDKAEDIERSLADYPVLDEEDHSSREWDEFCSDWNDYACRDMVRQIVKTFELQDAADELLLDADNDFLREWYMGLANEPYFEESSGVCIPVERFVKRLERKQVAALLRELRQRQQATTTSPEESHS